jgi:tol-pal system protein YbgF
MKRLTLGLAILAALSAAWPVMAQRASLADRVSALEQKEASRSQSTGQANVELLNRTTQMQDEIRSLRAIIEQLQNDLEQARTRSREQYIDMDSRVSAIEQGGAAAKPAAVPATAAAPAPGKTAASAPAGAGENADYQAAYQRLIKQGDAAGSAQLFQAFLQRYPDSALAPNAWYWLGESYYISQEFALALKSFDILGQRFEASSKAPDALLKAAYCHIELGQTDNGRQLLEQVIARYPNHPVTELARSRLRGLNLGQ